MTPFRARFQKLHNMNDLERKAVTIKDGAAVDLIERFLMFILQIEIN